METTTIKTTDGLDSISNDIDDVIESLVYGECRNSVYIKALQSILKRLDVEIAHLNS